MATRPMTAEDLGTLFDAFNRHDLDAIMVWFDPDSVFDAIGGEDPWGTRMKGKEAIAGAFRSVWTAMKDAYWDHHSHLVHGDRAVSEWTFTGTNSDGARIEAEGCDLFTLRDGKIVKKQAFRKQRPLIPAR